MKELLLIRHAETDMAGTFCGHSDPEINSRGQDQISDLIKKLAGEKIGLVCTSDLRRAVTTAKAIATYFNVDCQAHPALREINFGRWEGLAWREIEERDPHYAARSRSKKCLPPIDASC
jgi:alpha-ribazole phosphatase